MARRVIRYEGEGRHRRPIFEDLGPASAAGRGHDGQDGHATVARLSSLEASKVVGIGERLQGGAGAVERRMATTAQREAWRSERPAPASPIAPVRVGTPARPAMGSREHLRQSRMNGARRHVEVVKRPSILEDAAALGRQQVALIGLADPPVIPSPPEEEPHVNDVAALPPSVRDNDAVDPQTIVPDPDAGPLARLAIAAAVANDAWRERQRADAVWAEANHAWQASNRALSLAADEVRAFLAGEFEPELAEPAEPRRSTAAPAPDPTATNPAAALAAYARDRAAGDDRAGDDVAGEPGKTAAETRRAAAGGGPGLPPKQARILAATVKHKGDRKAVSADLKVPVSNIENQLELIGRKGLLPIDLIPLLPARFAKYSGVGSR